MKAYRPILAMALLCSVCFIGFNLNYHGLAVSKVQLRQYACQQVAAFLQSEISKLDRNDTNRTGPRLYYDGGVMNNTAPTSFAVASETEDDARKDPFLTFTSAKPQLVVGAGRKEKVKFSVGIPTVRRPSGVSYLYRTLMTLFRNLLPVNEDDVTVTLFVADDNVTYVKGLMAELQRNFTREIETGMLQIISRPYNFQPPENIESYFPEDPQRLKWRSNEVWDAAFLMYYSRGKADYYIMLEDDIESAKSYIQDIKDFLRTQSSFIFASLAQFGSIGKLFPSNTLPKWAAYLFTFYSEKPIDWLMADYLDLLSCHPEMSADNCKKAVAKNNPRINPKGGLFQHIGIQSSLEGKTQKIVDKGFRSNPGQNPHRNPGPLLLKSSYTAAEDSSSNSIESVYTDSGGLKESFMARSPQTGDILSVKFASPLKVNRILVRTGDLQGRYQMCANCALIETEYSVNSTSLCTFFDGNGQADCRPAQEITGFNIVNALPVPDNVWFYAIYVHSAES